MARRWTIESLMKSAAKLRRWRGAFRNYTSSTRRQHDRTIPFAGTNSVLLQYDHWGLTQSRAIHRIQLQFYDIDVVHENDWGPEHDDDKKYFIAEYKGAQYAVEKLSVRSPVRARCSCQDYVHRWAWPNYNKGALFGSKPKPYQRKTPPPPEGRPYVNPKEHPGLCKHVLNSFANLETSGYTKPGAKRLRTLRFT